MTVFYVTPNNQDKKIAVNSAKVSRILDTGLVRNIYYGTGNAVVDTLSTKDSLSKMLADTQFLKMTNYTTKKDAAVNGSFVSYILEKGSFREIWFGSNRIASANTSVLNAVEPMNYLTTNLRLVAVTENNTGRKVAVNPNVVYKVVNNSSLRLIYFGPVGNNVGPSSAVIAVKETVAQLAKLGIV